MRVLIPVDGGADCREAIRFVTSRKSWLEKQKPQIELLYVQKPYIEHPMEEGDFDIQSWYYDDKIKAVFEDMAEDIATLPENVIKTSKIGHPAKVIASYAREISADLIVMGARGLSALKNLYLGSVSLGTIARATCPVLVCREHYTPKDENLRIGIAVDGSGFGDLCTKFAIQNKDLFGTDASFEVIYVHADEETVPSELLDKGVLELDKLLPKYEHKEYTNAVESPLAQLKAAGLKAKPVELRGSLQTTLTHYADENLNMVVMGSHGKGRISSLVFGSSTRAMVASCRMPIFIVPGEA